MKRIILPILFTAVLMLTACTNKTDSVDNLSKQATTNSESATVELATTESESPTTAPTTAPTTVPATAESAAIATVEDLILPTTENSSGKVQIQTVSHNNDYPFTSYIITSSEGESVVIDPTVMPSKEIVDINPAAIVCTHGHPDHTDPIFTSSYDCKKILYTKDDINTKDFRIYTILSSHSGDIFAESNKNQIIVFEVDGLRIAHMGDLGQTVLTDDQLKELGDIDIAFAQFENSYSDMTLENEKGFNLIEQVNPKIIIPTHFTDAAFPVLEEKYGAITEFENILTISKDDLPEKALTVYHILNNHKYK